MSRDAFHMSDEPLIPEFTADGHLDEGTVHAWLDGMYDEEATAQVAAHIQGCASCSAMVAEARGLLAGSSRILALLDGAADSVVPGVNALRTAGRVTGSSGRDARAGIGSTRRIGRPWWYSTAAAAVLVLAVGISVWRRGGEQAANRTADQGLAQRGESGAAHAGAPARVATQPPASTLASPPTSSTTPSVGTPPAVVEQRSASQATTQEPIRSKSAVAAPQGGASGTTAATAAAVAAAPNDAVIAAATPAAPPPPTAAPPAAAPSVVSLSAVRGVAGGVARARGQVTSRRRSAEVAVGVARDAGTSAESRPPRLPGEMAANREQYDRIDDNPFRSVRSSPLSTFSIDVDRASYGNVRRFLQQGQRPPADAVRIEELINHFPYALREPSGNAPVAITTEVMVAPWQPRHQLVRIALQSQRIRTEALPPNNLVFLIDVSGSMQSPDKLPLVKSSLQLLVNELRPQDRVAIVAYAGAAGLVLPSTSGDEKERIMEAIDRLEAGGSTAGGAGIELAYNTARAHFLEQGNNRVILATDGDFNVGVSSDGELERLIERRRSEGTYLTILGFGSGNYQDAKMEKLARRGNGNYAYVDGIDEARKMLVREMGATLRTVANDVKLQIEFNPRRVQAYRLIGYEDRLLHDEDFTNDRKDAGDLGAGHQVTALYEIVPMGVDGTVTLSEPEPRRYEPLSDVRRGASNDNELLSVNLRFKRPGESSSQLLTQQVKAQAGRGSVDMRFASAVAAFGMLLRESPYLGNTSAAQVLEQARAALGSDEGGYRAEFVRLVERYRDLGVRADVRR